MEKANGRTISLNNEVGAGLGQLSDGRRCQNVAGKQADQIGRFFADWAIVYFGQFRENDKSSPHFGLLFQE
jgi:hypothetical protein